MITKHCQAKFAANVDFTPKVLDAGETMVLFNLPRPWILLCGHNKRPTEIEMATYKVVDCMEFCECSLTAGSFQLDETLVKCSPETIDKADTLQLTKLFLITYRLKKMYSCTAMWSRH